MMCEEPSLLDQRCLLEKMGIVDDRYGGWSEALAIYTDRIRWTSIEEFKRESASGLDRLLEVRAYNKYSEFHAVRSFMGARFFWRVICDEDYEEDAMFDDLQRLDINSRRKNVGNHYVATGGGAYELPKAGAKEVLLRNYIAYGEDGLASVDDFRIVELR